MFQKKEKKKIRKLNLHIGLDTVIASVFFGVGALNLSLSIVVLFFKDIAGDFATIFLSYDDFAAIGVSLIL